MTLTLAFLRSWKHHLIFTCFSGQCWLAMMVAWWLFPCKINDFQNWKIRLVPYFTIIIILLIIAQYELLEKFEFKRGWCLALFHPNTNPDQYCIYGTDTIFQMKSKNIEHCVTFYYALLDVETCCFQTFLTHSSPFIFNVSANDFPIDWFRYFGTFCNRSLLWIPIHVKFNI